MTDESTFQQERPEGRAEDASSTEEAPSGTAGVTLGVSGRPDRESLQESADTGTSDAGAALQRPDGMGATRGDDESFNTLPGQVSGVGGTQGSGAGNLEGSRG